MVHQQINSVPPTSRMYILRRSLKEEADLSKIEASLRTGHIIFIETSKFFDLHQDDVVMLKRTMDQLKKISLRRGGSMGRIGKNLLILTPNSETKLFKS